MAAGEVLHAILAEVDADSINPRAELGIAAERADGLEYLYEHFLRHVFGFVATAEHAQHETEHARFVEFDQLVERTLVSPGQALDELTLDLVVRVGHAVATVDRMRRRVAPICQQSKRGLPKPMRCVASGWSVHAMKPSWLAGAI